MPIYKSSASISASPETTWRILSNVCSWTEWLPTVSQVQPLDQPQLRVGGRFLIAQPKLRPATWTVSHLESPRSFVWESRSPGLVMVAGHTIVAESAGQSSVVLTYSFEGVIGVVVGRIYRALVNEYLSKEAASLKVRAEEAAAES